VSPSHPLDWNTASEVPGGKPWIHLIGGGLVLQVIGGILIGFGISSGSDQSPGETSHGGVATLVLGSISAWIGFVLLLVGLIAVGVYLGTRHLAGWRPGTDGPAPRPGVSRDAMFEVAGDRAAFTPNEGDSPVVAQIRSMYLTGAQFALKATTASVRRITSRAERRGQLTDADRAEIEAMIVEAHRSAD
jgi:hypothetical protein